MDVDRFRIATPNTEVKFRNDGISGVRYRSGLTIYDEALVDGRLVGRYWSTNGSIKPEGHIGEEKRARDLLPADAFILRVDDRILDRNWIWQAAREANDDRAGVRHVVVELAQEQHPFTGKV